VTARDPDDTRVHISPAAEFTIECSVEHDDGLFTLARVVAPSVPRIGDKIAVYDQRIERREGEPVVFKVVDVVWTTMLGPGAEDSRSAPYSARCGVIVEPDDPVPVTVHCACRKDHGVDERDRCNSCGRKRR
jgi:hypothetical protein